MNDHPNSFVYSQLIEIIQSQPSAGEQKMLSRLAQRIRQVFHAQICFIIADVIPTAQVETGYSSEIGELKFSPTSIREILSQIEPDRVPSQPLFFSSLVESKQHCLSEWLAQFLSVEAGIIIITHFQGKANGIVAIANSSPYQWKTMEQELMMITSQLAAIAINSVQLQQKATATSYYQNRLEEINSQIRRQQDMNSILNLALAETAKSLNTDRGFILMLKYDDPLLKKRLPSGVPEAKVEVVCQWLPDHPDSFESNSVSSFLLSDSVLCQYAWRNAPQPIAIADQTQLQTITNVETIPYIFQAQNFSSLLIIPFTGSYNNEDHKPVVLGFLVLQNNSPRSWQSEEIQLAKWVTLGASSSLIQSQTLQRIQSLVDKRTAQLQLSLDVQAKLSAKMRQHIEELKRLNQVKDDFIATLSDELKHPLTKMKMGIQMLKVSSNQEQTKRYLEIVESECGKEIELIDNLLTMQNLGLNQVNIHTETINLKEDIESIAESFSPELAQKRLNLSFEYPRYSNKKPKLSPLILYSERDSFQKIIRELIKNASKFSLENTTINISITKEKDAIEISLTNTGKGISLEEQKHIFEPFHRGTSIKQGSNQGTGLGLALVKSLVEHLNGNIKVVSHPLEDGLTHRTSFILTLPQLYS